MSIHRVVLELQASAEAQTLPLAGIPHGAASHRERQCRRGARLSGRRRFQVILVDVNILVYASNAESDHHAAARDRLDHQLNGSAPIGLPWTSLLAFLRTAMNTRAVSQLADDDGRVA